MEPIRILLNRCAALFRRRSLDEDLDAELRSHIEFALEENMKRGMSAAGSADAGAARVRWRHADQRSIPNAAGASVSRSGPHRLALRTTAVA